MPLGELGSLVKWQAHRQECCATTCWHWNMTCLNMNAYAATHWDVADASVTTWQHWNMACKLTGMCTVPYASVGTQKAHRHALLSIPLEAEGPSK